MQDKEEALELSNIHTSRLKHQEQRRRFDDDLGSRNRRRTRLVHVIQSRSGKWRGFARAQGVRAVLILRLWSVVIRN